MKIRGFFKVICERRRIKGGDSWKRRHEWMVRNKWVCGGEGTDLRASVCHLSQLTRLKVCLSLSLSHCLSFTVYLTCGQADISGSLLIQERDTSCLCDWGHVTTTDPSAPLWLLLHTTHTQALNKDY